MECGAEDRAAFSAVTVTQVQQRNMVEDAKRIPFLMTIFSLIFWILLE